MNNELGKKLFVAWGCCLIWEVGTLLAVFIWLRYAFSGFLFGEPPPVILLLLLALGLGLITVAPGPILMGLFFARSQRGIVGGLLALLVGAIALWLGWLGWGYTNLSLLLPALPSIAVITTVILTTTEPFPRRYLALGAGLIAGLGLSVVSTLFLVGIFGDGKLTPYIQIPLLIWVSAVYLLEVVRGRRDWKLFVLWVLLGLISVGLSFVADPIIDSVSFL